mmetsp:Transcript_125563/g.313756  ORF Transcript_125563/g.313756 Transcript_125563/m.313756 type:complete len:235 (-) Transcript_125563:660-1364(-)|eukprot:CAMPEP_0115169276 /NCGR_PEP_ID=MMETSP0270-20121206/1187_1 /TAXON_ID=71861 /ORGANISM="Scrippsiella trochoidea, Strain CCMP3099" /LENGTH=234 /DNA_ID=CAMNT_0002581973 /DNA_START=49 /DNA_END=753 /DNA_ORIENTATION=+
MALVGSIEIEQMLTTILNGVDQDIAAEMRAAIKSDGFPLAGDLSLTSRTIPSSALSTRLLATAISNERLTELCAKLAGAWRERLDGNGPCQFICELVSACQKEFESLQSSLELDHLDRPQAMAKEHRLDNLMAFIGQLFLQQAIRGNSIIQCLLNGLLGWDQEQSRWQGQPQEYQVKSARKLLWTIGVYYVGKTQGSRVYLSRLRTVSTARSWSETTQRELTELINTWEQEWAP